MDPSPQYRLGHARFGLRRVTARPQGAPPRQRRKCRRQLTQLALRLRRWPGIAPVSSVSPKRRRHCYPCLIEARGRCPPEDVGGPWGCREFPFDDDAVPPRSAGSRFSVSAWFFATGARGPRASAATGRNRPGLSARSTCALGYTLIIPGRGGQGAALQPHASAPVDLPRPAHSSPPTNPSQSGLRAVVYVKQSNGSKPSSSDGTTRSMPKEKSGRCEPIGCAKQLK